MVRLTKRDSENLMRDISNGMTDGTIIQKYGVNYTQLRHWHKKVNGTSKINNPPPVEKKKQFPVPESFTSKTITLVPPAPVPPKQEPKYICGACQTGFNDQLPKCPGCGGVLQWEK